jgi:copper(I)-binding protein
LLVGGVSKRLALAVAGIALASVVALAWGLPLFSGGGIEVTDERAVVLPSGMAGVYMRITNNYEREVCIVDVELKSHPGARAELHQTRAVGERVEMAPVRELCIPPKSSVDLKPGSYHIMVMGLKGSPSVEDDLVIDLVLDNGERVEVVVEVTAARIPE